MAPKKKIVHGVGDFLVIFVYPKQKIPKDS